MLKERLFTPGPTTIPLRVLQAMQVPAMHHRTDLFKQILQESISGIKSLIESDTDPIFVTASGTGAMEAALINICSPQDKVIVLNAGQFGQRWIDLAVRLKLNPIEIKCEWGSSVTEDTLRSVLRKHSDAKLFCLQCCETSTAVLHPLDLISKSIKEVAPEMLLVVDAISAIATLPINVKELGIDILVAAAHKGLMLPPGLSFLALSERAWSEAEKLDKRAFYFDLCLERESHQKGTTSWTPAIPLFLGLNESLRMIREEGLDNVYARHAQLSRATRAGLTALGVKLLAAEYPSPGVSAAYPLKDCSAEELRSIALKQLGIRLAGGQGSLKGKIFRIGHMGYCDRFDVLNALAAVELALLRMGADVESGQALSAAMRVFAE